jgi:hypothetical protein
MDSFSSILALYVALLRLFCIYKYVDSFDFLGVGRSARRIALRLRCIVQQYDGPISLVDVMEAGWGLEEFGINLMVGPSVYGEGRGLFMSLEEGVEKVTLPQGSILCGYSRGSFFNVANGDKTVGYQFCDPLSWVLYEKKLMHVYDAIQQISEKVSDLNHAVAGHLVQILAENNGQSIITIQPNISDQKFKFYFVPDDAKEITIMNAAMFANDLAYHSDITEEEYEAAAKIKNILTLVWRVEFDGCRLQPSWPVVVTNKDVELTNELPMEVGIEYSWRYWDAVRKKEEEGNEAS